MFEVREKKHPKADEQIQFVDANLARSDPNGEVKRRHATLMDCLNEERDLQQEERVQAAIDEDGHDHLQWQQEHAIDLIERGQAPLVFNQARQSIDWLAGMEKRLRKDYKILPREPNDAQGAEVKTQVVKYTDDVNLTQWHTSRAFKQAAISGLSWLEEGINKDPEEELIYSGSEDWRHVYRDSRDRTFDLANSRYLFRRKLTDLDYAVALLPKAKQHLQAVAATHDDLEDDADGIWYLGERLTGASDLVNDGLPSSMVDRRAYIGSSSVDRGRRTSVELLECWYRVPETVQVWDGGPFDGRVFNPAELGHQQAKQDRLGGMYEAVKMRMRVMIATKDQPLWDGVSPFRHGRFLLVPIWGYRRYRDGLAYGLWRGMRDIQDDVNKRASKALWLLSSNRVVADKGAVEDVEVARQEAARPDGWIEKVPNKELRFEYPMQRAEAEGNLQMMDRNIQMLRDVGGVTNANLGRGASGQSGISVERQQDQGSLTTSELFDNLLLAIKLRGKLRLSHIEQFKTKRQIIRIVGEGRPLEWLVVNDRDPVTGEYINDLTAREADFIVSTQDYRESYARSAMESMMELLGQVATYAPQVVMAVLDLVVASSEIKDKDEWVARIRQITGQRDPTKPMTPADLAKQFAEQQKAMLMDKMAMQRLTLDLKKLEGEIGKLDSETMLKRVEGMLNALQAAQIVAVTPAVAPVADEIAKGAGFQDQGGQDPNLPAPGAPVRASPPQDQLPPAMPAGQPQPPVPAAEPAIPA